MPLDSASPSASLLAALVLLMVAPPRMAAQAPPPIIDVHIHAFHVADFGPTPTVCSDNRGITWPGWDPKAPFTLEEAGTCAAARWTAPKTDAELLRQTLAAFERYNIRAVTTGPIEEVAKWRAAAPARVIPAVDFFGPGHDARGRPVLRDLGELRRLVREGKAAVFAEVAPQYDGMSPADPALDPYFALAEELDIPVGIHMGEGPPGGRNIMFGSDQMVWPQTIGLAIETIESADFLTPAQKRDILHDNAARFLRLEGAAAGAARGDGDRRRPPGG